MLDLTPMLHRDGWFIIAATREDVGPHDHPDNLVATEMLQCDLIFGGFEPEIVDGIYKGVDQGVSFFARGSEEQGLDLARRYGQESILTNRGLIYTDGRPHTPASGILYGAEAEAQDFYSKPADGPAFSFVLDF